MKQLLTLLSLLLFTFINAQVKEVFLQSKMDGEKTLSDGTEVQFWGYGIENPVLEIAREELPGPILRFDLGDTVLIHLNNVSPEDHTIHWHGLDVDQENDGVGHTSNDVHAGTSFTYQFVCNNAGTYLYHCHVMTPLHLAMGMYGLFIVDGENDNCMYDTTTKYSEEYAFLLSEMNTAWSIDPLNPGPFALYEADYIMVNGYADEELDSTDQIVYGILEDTLGFRFANMGYGKATVFFPEELDVVLVGSDGRKLNEFITLNQITLYPGERFEVIAKPNTLFEGIMSVEYYDLRTNALIGLNNINVSIMSALGTVEHNSSEKTLTLFPNPANNILNVQYTGSYSDGVILDITGRIVSKVNLANASTIDIGNLQKGTYFFKINEVSVKFIKN